MGQAFAGFGSTAQHLHPESSSMPCTLLLPRCCAIAALVTLVATLPAFAWPPKLADPKTIGPHTEQVDRDDYERILFVSAGANENDADGSRERPYPTLAAAVAAIGDATSEKRQAVFVMAGRYSCVRLQMKPHVDLFGGFDPDTGGGRDILRHAVTLDAEFGGPIILGASDARLDGFVLTDGRHEGHGGAIYCDGASPEISNNYIIGNATQEVPGYRSDLPYQRGFDGGGIALFTGSTALVRNNLIADNATRTGTGGGIAVWNFANPRIVRNVICNNRTGLSESPDIKKSSRSSAGAGISVNYYCQVEITENIITLNNAGGNSDAGAVYLEHEGSATMRGNRIVGNFAADDGGGMYVMKTAHLILEDNLIAGNRNRNGAGGVRLSQEGRMTANGNLLVANTTGFNITESWAEIRGNAVVDNVGTGGIAYTNMYPHIAPPVITENVVARNQPEQILVAQTASGKPRIDNNAVGESSTNSRWFADDAVAGTVAGATFDPAAYVTTLEIEGSELEVGALAGRVIRAGDHFSVVKSNTANRITVWAQLPNGDGQFEVLNSYQPLEGTPAHKLLMTRNAN
jgi:hypothetical protein